MGHALQGLVDEHRIIEDVLDTMAAFLASRQAPFEDDRKTLAAFAEFFRDYADGIHHHKEETLLFGRLLRDGDMSECGSLNRYLADHNLGRDAVRRIARAGAGNGPLSDPERASATRAAGDLDGMLRDHIAREDRDLFPAAERVLPAESLNDLLLEFERYDRDPETVARRERCLGLATDLGRRFLPGPPIHGENR